MGGSSTSGMLTTMSCLLRYDTGTPLAAVVRRATSAFSAPDLANSLGL